MFRTDRKATLDAKETRLRALLIDALAGDAPAYRAFLRELAVHLRQFLRRRFRDRPDDIEDLVQECLIAVHDKRHTYDASQPLTPWLQAIARYKLADHWRRARIEVASDDVEEALDILAEGANDAADAKRDVAKLLGRLPEKQRLPIVHVKIEGLSVAETAGITGMSMSAVKVGIHRGLKALAAIVRAER
ncbi:MAG TPA: sigma-70 family RNA polymerase sigma factor [Casimicrobiaceae bacterium]|nr:sigma-70 family RNA polymerase sigma factor [Casimicrobiaceae bacterium]